MATVISTLGVKMDLDTSGFNRKMDEVGRKLDAVGTRLRDIGTTLTTRVTAPIVGGFALAVNAASDLNETINKTNVVFDDAAAGVMAWSEDSATAFGLSQNEALGFASTFGNIFTAMGFTADAAADMSTGFVALGADLGSFNNVPTAEALEAIRAGLLGEYEPLRRFGIVLSDAEVKAYAMANGLVDANGEISAQNMVLARQALIAEKSANAQGDFANTSGSLANQMKILRARLTDAAASIGQVLLPYVTRLVGFISRLIERFDGMSTRMKTVIVVVGLIAAAIGPLLLVFGFAAGALGNIIALLPKIKMFFNVLRAGMLSSLGPILLVVAAIAAIYFIWTRDLFGIKTKITKWFNVFKAPGGGLDRLKAKFGEFKDTLGGLYRAALPKMSTGIDRLRQALVALWDRVKGPLGSFVKLIGDGVVKAVRWAMDNLYRLQPLLDAIGAYIHAVVALVRALFAGDWSAAWDAFKNVVEAASIAALEAFRLAWDAIKGIASRIDWGALVSGAAGLGYKLLGYIDDLGGILWGWAKAGATFLAMKLATLWDDHKSKIGEVAGFLVSKIDDVGLLLWGWIQAGATWMAGKLAGLWDEHGDTIKQLPGRFVAGIGAVGSFLWGWLETGAKWMAGKLAGLWDAHKQTISQLPGRFIAGIGAVGALLWVWLETGAKWFAKKVSGLWDAHKDTISQLPGRFVAGIGAIGALLWSWAKTGAKWFAGKVSGLWDAHKDTIGQIPGRLITAMGALGALLWGWAKTGASYLGTQASKIWDNVKPQIAAIPGALISAMGGLGGKLYEWVKAGASDALDSVTGAGSDALTSMRSIGTQLGAALKSAFNGALSGIGDYIITKINGIIRTVNGWIENANRLPGVDIPYIPTIGGGSTIPGGGGSGGGQGGFVAQALGMGGAQVINATININVTGVDSPKTVAQEVYATFSRELGLRGAI
jgi:hypothetical protein